MFILLIFILTVAKDWNLALNNFQKITKGEVRLKDIWGSFQFPGTIRSNVIPPALPSSVVVGSSNLTYSVTAGATVSGAHATVSTSTSTKLKLFSLPVDTSITVTQNNHVLNNNDDDVDNNNIHTNNNNNNITTNNSNNLLGLNHNITDTSSDEKTALSFYDL